MTSQRPPNLTRSGVIAWNKLTENQKKYRPEEYLRSGHFTSYENYEKFIRERRIAPFRERLLDGVSVPFDPVFTDNLSDILADFSEQLAELDSGKQDKPYDW